MANWRKQKFNKYGLGAEAAAELNNKHNISGSSNPFSSSSNPFQALGLEFDALLDLTGSTPLFFTNPNKDGKVKKTTMLNNISKDFRENYLPELDTTKITEGFEINPTVFKWEWIMDAYNSRLVFRENLEQDCIDVWFYRNKTDHKAEFDYGLKYKNNKLFMVNVLGFIDIAKKLTNPAMKNKKLHLHKAM